MTALWIALAALAGSAAAVALAIRRRHMTRWLPAYLRGDWAGRREAASARTTGPTHVMFCIADHFEPGLGQAPEAVALRRVERWVRDYPQLVAPFRDADGRPPRHTFFFPAEQYRPELLDRLGEMVRAGLGEVEVHLHHDRDTSASLEHTLLEFAERLAGHGHLGSDRLDGRKRFAFVHGNWALDNSLPDGRWCGVNDELRVLRRCGCYADFTLPSAPSPAQTRRINSIYYAVDDPLRPRSHDDGIEARAGCPPCGDLLIVQGPLVLTWPGGRYGLLPRVETGNLAAGLPPTPRRLDAWLRARVCVAGRPDWIFIKLYTHGCKEKNWPVLLGPPMRDLHRLLQERCNDGRRFRLHYVAAREMVNIIKAAERGLGGDPGAYRDLEIAPPPLAVERRVASRAAWVLP